jgi:fluoride exporter
MFSFFLVFTGGGLGSICRWQISSALQNTNFPWATLIANALASFVLGYLAAMNIRLLDNSRWLFLATGFCGGFSTFSTFSLESFKLLETQPILGAINIVLNVILCLVLVFCGFYAGK